MARPKTSNQKNREDRTTPEVTIGHLVCVTYRANAQSAPRQFIGKTEVEARKKLQKWLEQKQAPRPGLVGKIWMMHHQNLHRIRVDPTEKQKYLDLGYEQGGPHTPFRANEDD